MKRRRISYMAYLIFIFIGIGLISSIIAHPGYYAIPITIAIVIFLLYRFPPDRWRSLRSNVLRGRVQTNKTQRKKASPFRVIQGNKGRDDDDYPRYH